MPYFVKRHLGGPLLGTVYPPNAGERSVIPQDVIDNLPPRTLQLITGNGRVEFRKDGPSGRPKQVAVHSPVEPVSLGPAGSVENSALVGRAERLGGGWYKLPGDGRMVRGKVAVRELGYEV